MGYMGFGMRKEVYTRRPKEVFGAYKKQFGDKTYKLQRTYSADDEPDSPLAEYDRQSSKRRRERLIKIFIFTMVLVEGVALFVTGIWGRIS